MDSVEVVDELKVVSTSHKEQKNRSYTMEFKSNFVDHAKTHSIRETAIKFNVDRQSVREWKRQQGSIRSSNSKKKRLSGGGRKVTSEYLEETLLIWIHERRSRMLHVSRKMIMYKAKALFDNGNSDPSALDAFVVSRGWLQKFMQ